MRAARLCPIRRCKAPTPESPPTLLVCLNRSSGRHGVFAVNGTLCVDALDIKAREDAGALNCDGRQFHRLRCVRESVEPNEWPILD